LAKLREFGGGVETPTPPVGTPLVPSIIIIIMLIDVEIPRDRNAIKKEPEKILKYKDLTIEIQRMWNVKN
jgi:hypothetical protein